VSRNEEAFEPLKEAKSKAKNLVAPPMFKKSLMQLSEFSESHSGAKSNNLRFLQDKVKQGVNLPESVCIPFQVLEYVLDLNKSIK
jgi:hypothetical protein